MTVGPKEYKKQTATSVLKASGQMVAPSEVDNCSLRDARGEGEKVSPSVAGV